MKKQKIINGILNSNIPNIFSFDEDICNLKEIIKFINFIFFWTIKKNNVNNNNCFN